MRDNWTIKYASMGNNNIHVCVLDAGVCTCARARKYFFILITALIKR